MQPRLFIFVLALLFNSMCLAANGSPDWEALTVDLGRDPIPVRDKGLEYLQTYQQAGDTQQALFAVLLVIDADIALEDYTPIPALIERGLSLANAQNEFSAQARLYRAKGNVAASRSDNSAAKKYYEQALKLCSEHRLEKERAFVLTDLSRLKMAESLYNQALPPLFESYAIFQKLRLKAQEADTLASIGDAYGKLGDAASAVEYYHRARKDLDPEHDKFSLSVILYNEAVNLQTNGQIAEAERLMRLAMQYSIDLRDEMGAAYARYRLGIFAQNRGELTAADGYFYTAQSVFENGKNDSMQFLVQLHRAEVLTKFNANSALAALLLAKTVGDKIPTPERKMQYHEAASKVYKQLGRYRESLDELEAWVAEKTATDALFSRKITSEMQVKFNAKQKETENALLKSEQQRQAAELMAGSNRRWLLVMALVSAMALLGTLAFVLRYQIRQKRRFADLALHDELTKAPNRRHILSYGHRQLAACRAVGNDFCVAVLDLDHFKSINDRFGHEMGDEVLKSFAMACQQGLRKGDRLGRLGGEEWLLVMPATKLDELPAIFSRLQAAVLAYQPASLPDSIKVTFSMGGCQADGDEGFTQLLQRADEAMYTAKHQGRNQLVIARR